ncbi:MAG: LPS export ABC transporter periplasmic protein LptC [Alphaproteobacteria bacterium]|nr:LPS export ABC transporter periplasmic protein LptC [Alphaproteobacteria bacterium]
MQGSPDSSERLKRIGERQFSPRPHSTGYSRFIRHMRLILPLMALALVAAVFTWRTTEKNFIVRRAQEAKSDEKMIGRNELVNPRFESVDQKNRPYTVVAKRAVRGEAGKEENTITLEEPIANMKMENGSHIAAQAAQGIYTQTDDTLLLQGGVQLSHDKGYRVDTQTLRLNLKKGTALTETPVRGEGPLGSLEAHGLRADEKQGLLWLKGPAKLIITQSASNLDKEGIFP